MAVISVRVPDELKEKMKRYDINWSEEIRRFIEQKIRDEEKAELLNEIDSFLKSVLELGNERAQCS